MRKPRKNKFLVVGGGGREAAIAERLADDCVICAVAPHANPNLITAVSQTGGVFLRGDSINPDTLVRFARAQSIDYAFVNADAALAQGRSGRPGATWNSRRWRLPGGDPY